ncbi:hypothetical protein AB5I39_04085 [Sphingomonas sp. MMS24-J45]|uniref:hypothetical protein n=1 Tax=Sphingomonas sp. MMS24-J45 TaxID=3238806 RepID=UPI0038508F20
MDDLARQLPDPPPPRPAARTATIAAAMAKFDGVEAPAKAAPVRAPRWQISRGPAAAFASMVVVALVAVPLVLLKPNDRVAGPPVAVRLETSAQPAPVPARPPARVAQVAPPPVDAAAVETRSEQRAMSSPAPVVSNTAADVPPPPAPVMAAPAPVAEAMPAPPPPPPPPPPASAAYAAAPQAKAAPVALAARRAADDTASQEIVVSGSRIRAAPRGDWNACTVDDPTQRLRGCGAAISDGLTKAWQGDWGAAIAAFDAAIAREPKLGAAYLNRGLAYWRSGDTARAAADLDLAVRYAPSARSYYNRARLRRANGNIRGAHADEARALERDQNYADVIGE